MQLNTAMRFVEMRAEAEAAALGHARHNYHHVFLGLLKLKLSELTANEFAPSSRHKEAINTDIKAVRKVLSAQGIESKKARYSRYAKYTRSTILNALENDSDPKTSLPYFPSVSTGGHGRYQVGNNSCQKNDMRIWHG